MFSTTLNLFLGCLGLVSCYGQSLGQAPAKPDFNASFVRGIAPSAYFAVRVRVNQQPWQSVFVHHSRNSLDSLGGLSFGIFSVGKGTVELEITPGRRSDPKLIRSARST